MEEGYLSIYCLCDEDVEFLSFCDYSERLDHLWFSNKEITDKSFEFLYLKVLLA